VQIKMAFRVGNCKVCGKVAYPQESLEYDKQLFHKTCFKCLNCKNSVSLTAVAMINGELYCKNCFVRMFHERGSYKVFSNPGEGRAPSSVPSSPEPEREVPKDEPCESFVQSPWKPTTCKSCGKQKSEHSEAAQRGDAKKEEAKVVRQASIRKIGCKFGFKPTPTKSKADICVYCGRKQPEHESDGDMGDASPSPRPSGVDPVSPRASDPLPLESPQVKPGEGCVVADCLGARVKGRNYCAKHHNEMLAGAAPAADGAADPLPERAEPEPESLPSPIDPASP